MKKRIKTCIVLFLLIFVMVSNSIPFNPFVYQNPRSAGSTPPTFTSFSPFETTDKTPDVSIQVNDSESGLNVDSAYYAFTTNGSEPIKYCNPYRDDFNDGVISDFWSFINQDNGTFIESGSNINITDLDNGNWAGDTRTAPYMYQRITGDFKAQVKLSVNLAENTDVTGLLVRNDNDDFFRVQYIWPPQGTRKNIAVRYSINGSETRVAAISNVGDINPLWLRIERKDDEFAGLYSLDGYNWDVVGFDDLSFSQTVEIGMFVGSQLSVSFDDWIITPWIECTGGNTTTSTETVTIHDVQFNHYSEDENKIKFKISDMNDNVAYSSTYTVNITEIIGPVNFSDFQPIETDERNPAVQVSVEDTVNGINNFSASYAFSKSGKDPVAFMNPYSDGFDDGIIQDCWENINPLNGNLEESLNGLNFTDTGVHVWNATNHDAPCLTENIAGTFRTIIKINPLDLNENKSAGIIAILNENYAFKVLIENKSGTVNVTFYIVSDTTTTLISELTPSQINPIWLRLSREGDEWTAHYSIDGDTYANYFTIGSYTFTSWIGSLTSESNYYPIPRAAAKVGLIVEQGASILFEDWEPTPKIDVSGVNRSTSKEKITVNTVYFEQFSQTDNKIIFRINSTNNEVSTSSIFTVNSTTIYEFRDHTLLSDGTHLKIIDGQKNTIWEWDENAGEKEMLPNGNLLVVQFGDNQGANAIIKEINTTTSEVVWNISIVGGHPLNWTHDVDYLGFDEYGDETYLIADTSNNRVVEFYRNGTIKWGWNATETYTYGYSGEGDPLLENGWDWTHLNDADRLPDGSTLVSLRNFDKVIIINTTATKEILWEYGEYGNYTLCNHIHNPQYTPQGTIIISDSDNHRVIEVNMTTKEIIWEYNPTGDEFLGWPRDADLLPNGNMLISDSANNGGKNRIWEIVKETKEVVWYVDTEGNNYEADRLDTILPTVDIKSPTNTTYKGSVAVTVSLENEDPWYDEMFYRIYDNSDGIWLTTENITYFGPTQAILENLHSYTLHAWGKDVYMEEGAYPTSRAIIQWDYDSVDFTVNLSSQYDPSAPFPGNTLISHYLKEVSPEGDILWSYEPEGKISWDAERLPNGNYLFSICDDYHIDPNVPLVNSIIEMTPAYEVIWNYTIYGPLTSNHEIHDVDKLSNGNYLIADMSQDRVIEVNSTYDIVWEWNSIDHLLPPPGPIPEDWVHLNDVDRLPNGNTLMTLRNYDSVIEVNPAGDIVWKYGDLIYDMSILPINHTILWGPHNADRLSNGNTMVADSRNHRILEVDTLGNVVWELNDSHVDLLWPRDCDRLPNGNILIADSLNSRIIEVNSTFDIVWEYNSSDLTYEADRIDLTAPTLNINSPLQHDILNNTVIVDISSPDLDTDTIWYRFFNETSSNWVDLTSQGGSQESQTYDGDPDNWLFEDGDYILWVWANDTGYPMLGSDQHINIREVQIPFEVGYGLNIIKPVSNQFFSNTTFDFEIIVRVEGTLNQTWYTLDNGLHNYTFTGLTGTISQSAWDAMSEGYVTIRFYANNSLGAEVFNEVTVLKDITPPITNITFVPYSGSSNVLKSTLFTLTADDSLGSGIGNIKYKIGDNSWVDYTGPFNLSDYAFGSYIISYYAIDNANNTESVKTISVNLVNVKSGALDPIIVVAIVVSITSIAAIGVAVFYILRKRMIAQSDT